MVAGVVLSGSNLWRNMVAHPMTPEPMPARLRREAARWGDSKLAELLTQAAEEMEAVEREGEQAKRLVDCGTSSCGNCRACVNEQADQAEAQLAGLERVSQDVGQAVPIFERAAGRSLSGLAVTGIANVLEAQLAASRAENAEMQSAYAVLAQLHVDTMAERDASRAEGERLRGALEALEWEGICIDGGEMQNGCPACHEPQSRGRHTATCSLKAALTPASPGLTP